MREHGPSPHQPEPSSRRPRWRWPRNVGSYDGAIRFVTGMLLLVFANHGHTWGWFGLPLIACAAIEFCPVWHLFGIDTTAGERIQAASIRTLRASPIRPPRATAPASRSRPRQQLGAGVAQPDSNLRL